jgi:hypothetical protein
MARARIYNYVFTPGTAGLGTIQVPNNIPIEDFLAIYNTTDNLPIYNFADNTLGGTAVWTPGTNANFPTAYAGTTTLTLNASTVTMSGTDELAIYYDDQNLYTVPWNFGVDAIGRSRVSEPESLIDADFEYGLQKTKWENVSVNNYIPGFYEDIGGDIIYNVNGYASLLAGDDVITSNTDTAVRLSNPTSNITGAPVLSPQWGTNDHGLLISQTQGNTLAFTTTYVTANVASSAERTFNVGNTSGFSVGDNVVLLRRPVGGTGGTTIAVANVTSNLTTTINVANAAAASIVDGSYIVIQTDIANVTEVCAVTGVVGNVLTVTRQTNQTNPGNGNLLIGSTVNNVDRLEVCRIDEVTSATQVQLTRGWYNIPAASQFGIGSVMQKLSSNVELVQLTSASTAVNGSQTIVRGEFSTTALTAAGTGSLLVRMTGIFYSSGDNNLPRVGVNQNDTPIDAGEFVSSQNTEDTNVDGINLVFQDSTNYFFYYPRRSPMLPAGFPVNNYASVVRQAFPYTGANFDIVSIVSDGANPSTITITTRYAHGMVPGTPILVNLTSGTNQAYGEGSFLILSVPSTTTFTYQGKTGAAVSGSLDGQLYVRSNATFLPRPFDGGVIISSGSPTRGASAQRQTKKYFRYQSGKGIFFSTGTTLQPTFDIADLSATGTAIGSDITVTVDLPHGCNPGATCWIQNVTTSGYNSNQYVITEIVSDIAFKVEAQAVLGSVTPVLGQQPRVSITSWHGAAVRTGMYDDQNGMFWEHDGQNCCVVQRSSTSQLAGLVSIGIGSNLVTGDGTCRFQDQLNNGDIVVVRGMTYAVTSIIDNNRMTVVPPFRGVENQTRVKMAVRTEIRVRQPDFNIDVLDGTGPSGFTYDATKMQMYALEYSWYGAGSVIWMIRGQDGRFTWAHRRINNNINIEAFMRTGNLPARYEAINETPVSALAGAIGAGDTQITLQDATDYPAASVTYPVFVMIDSEVIKYTAKSGNTLQGCTRGATFTQWIEGANRSFTSSAATSHDDNTGVIIISNTCTPLVNHWGSAVIMDGNFNGDEGFQFTFNRTNLGLPAAVGQKQLVFAMRLAPSVSNGIIGNLGQRDLVNRSALALTGLNIQVTTGRFLVEGIINPNNIDSANTAWVGINNAGGGFQPSFTQFSVAPRYTDEGSGGVTGAPLNTIGGFNRSGVKVVLTRTTTYSGIAPTNISSSGSGANISVQLTNTGTTYSITTTAITVQVAGSGYAVGDTLRVLGNVIGGATPANDMTLTVAAVLVDIQGGERLFAIPVSSVNQGVLDLGQIKQLGTSAIPGTGTFPNGPEVLAVTIQALSTVSNPIGEVQISFQESQA